MKGTKGEYWVEWGKWDGAVERTKRIEQEGEIGEMKGGGEEGMISFFVFFE